MGGGSKTNIMTLGCAVNSLSGGWSPGEREVGGGRGCMIVIDCVHTSMCYHGYYALFGVNDVGDDHGNVGGDGYTLAMMKKMLPVMAMMTMRPKQMKDLFVFHNFFRVGAGGRIFYFYFFFKSRVKATWKYSFFTSSKVKVQISLLTKNKSLHTSFKPVLKCKQVDNNNFTKYF